MQSNVSTVDASNGQSTRPFRFLRLRAVCDRTGLSRSQIYRLEAAGQFCPRVKLSESCSAWIEEEVEQWCAKRVAQSRGTSESAAM